MNNMNLIVDPADRATPEMLDALERRYQDSVEPVLVPDYAERYSNLCDLVCQLLWPEKYGTDAEDPFLHTSAPARAIARAIMDAAGIEPQADRR